MMYVFSDKTLESAIVTWANEKLKNKDCGDGKNKNSESVQVDADSVNQYCDAIREFMQSQTVIDHKMTVTVNEDK